VTGVRTQLIWVLQENHVVDLTMTGVEEVAVRGQNERSAPQTEALDDLRGEVAEGLLYTHGRLNANTSKTLEAASFTYALVELLEERGLISIEELDERKRAVGQRLARQLKDTGMGVMLQDPEYDKYAFDEEAEIDCPSRVHLCHAACCRLPFALSKQDIREGIVLWDLGQPYLIAHGEDGYCRHMDRGTCACTVREHRPVPCRAYDCRQDKRIWLDFERRVINPEINRPDWPACLASQADGAAAC
ncbi:MAG: YkgJ family cysteine cluster protein, partial [Chloroflexota bacterium]|nr:YkgJ family cysteine cluster protein [Chloroflexota bacterium]